MSETKTILYGGGDNSLSAMLPALLQNKGIDPASLSAIMNNNRGGLLGNNGFGDIIALIVIAAIFGNGNFGFGNNGNNNQAATAEREMLMQALQRNGVDISQLAQSINCSNSQILQGINSVANSICGLGNQLGQNTNQIITAIMQGNNAMATQLAECCCTTKQIISQGFSDLGYATRDQTCAIEKAIAASTSQILEGQRAAELRNLQDKLEAAREKNSQQATAINNYQQTQTFAAMLQPISASIGALQSDVDGIKCKLPNTVTVPNPQVAAIPACVAAQYGLYGLPFANPNGSFF